MGEEGGVDDLTKKGLSERSVGFLQDFYVFF